MARRKTVAEEAASPAEEAAPPRPTRTYRRRGGVSPEAQVPLLAASVLRARGARGADLEALQSVVAWARSVGSEADTVRTLAASPRRSKSQLSPERQNALTLNQLLLADVLSGAVNVDVDESGALVFTVA